MPKIFTDGDTVYITWEDRPDEFVVAAKEHTVRIAGSPPSTGCTEWRPAPVSRPVFAGPSERTRRALEVIRGTTATKES